ncbi:MAG: radical SAM protein [Candidatus Micrarchaeota archaeon]
MSMKVMLINPPPVDGIRYSREGRCQEKESVLGAVKPPLTLLYIASLAREAGHEIVLVDANTKRLDAKKTSALVLAYSPDVIFITTSTSTVDADFDCLPPGYGGAVFVIGAIAKSIPGYVFAKHPAIKGIVIGDPEAATEDILKGNLASPGGVLIREGGRMKAVQQKSETDIDNIPIPAWDLVDFKDYLLPNNGKPYAIVEISRGCPHNCNFCVTGLVHGKRIRSKNPERLIREVSAIKERYCIMDFYFLADSPFSDKKQIRLILEALISARLGIKWMSNARLDTIDEDIGRLLASSGCWMLAVGIESGSDMVRDAMDKKMASSDIKKGLSILKKNGIKTLGFFIFGAWGETKETISDTMRLSLQLDVTFANFYPAIPYPGTAFYALCKKGGFLTSSDLSRYDYSDFVIDYRNGVDRAFVLSKKKEAYLRFYLRPAKLMELAASMNPISIARCGIGVLGD